MSDAPIADPPEVRVLVAYLNRVRDAVIESTSGLDDAQLRGSTVSSGTNLLGLVHHLTGVERHWLQQVFLGATITADKGMRAPDEATAIQIVETYRQTCARSDEIVEACGDLSAPAAIPNPGEAQRDSLRVILVHLIEETARHAGHADILREQIDDAAAR